MASDLLIEIGTEEIPSDYFESALKEMGRLAETYLKENRIEIGTELEVCATPRRLVLIGKAIADKQEDVSKEITGPPKKAAFDEKGNPTKAAFGFAEKQGVSVEELQFLKTPKGEYVFVKRTIPGRTTREILSEVLPRLISDIPWPKSMRWGELDFPFVRPIHWVLALFGGEVICFEVAGVKSGNKTRGHRFMAPQTMEVADLQDYLRKMKESSVIIDHEAREKEVKKIVMSAAKTVSGTPAMDPELLSIVTNMVEFPSAVCGSFEKEFLNIPEPVLITAMKKHQRYFAVRDSEGQLMPNFVAVNNTVARDESVVQKGHERVLRARLSDADFFFKEDRKRPLKSRLEDLKEVIYQAKLGTSFAKVQRFTQLTEYLVEQILPEKMDDVRLAAALCKCDLVTEMVMEFPTLQGIMGKEYALLDGHPGEVCLAVYEHYLPARASDELPTSPIGAIVGLGDRMDTVSGFFAIEMEPTGAADPFALRRHALAIIRILEKMQWNISLEEFIAKSLSILREEIEFDKDLVSNKVLGFFRERYKNMMLRSGYESDLIDAIISVNFDQINQLRSRIDQLKKFMTESEEFESLALTFKRVTNILRNQDESFPVDANLFRESCESKLWETYQALEDDIRVTVEREDYFEALNLMVRLRKPVDDLFDGVEILTKEDTQLRDNRVGMLQTLARLFLSLADFSKFSI
ncbi:MAG: glycine--tRNA ligase subunit beta [Desulfobacteraceae bacterium]|jgi:glycyl-tRNA synthetase beta chain